VGIITRWEDNCPIGHAVFISDCLECYKKHIGIKELQIEKLRNKIPNLPKDKYKIGEHTFND